MAYYDGINDYDVDDGVKRNSEPEKLNWSDLATDSMKIERLKLFDKMFEQLVNKAKDLEEKTKNIYIDPLFVYPNLDTIDDRRDRISAELQIEKHNADKKAFDDANKAWKEVYDAMTLLLSAMGFSKHYIEFLCCFHGAIISRGRHDLKVFFTFKHLNKHIKSRDQLIAMMLELNGNIQDCELKLKELRQNVPTGEMSEDAKKIEQKIVQLSSKRKEYNDVIHEHDDFGYAVPNANHSLQPTLYFQVNFVPEEENVINVLVDYYENVVLLLQYTEEHLQIFQRQFSKKKEAEVKTLKEKAYSWKIQFYLEFYVCSWIWF
jgi:hypothetical protein